MFLLLLAKSSANYGSNKSKDNNSCEETESPTINTTVKTNKRKITLKCSTINQNKKSKECESSDHEDFNNESSNNEDANNDNEYFSNEDSDNEDLNLYNNNDSMYIFYCSVMLYLLLQYVNNYYFYI